MTFTEAALAVLKQEGRPMHSREIADKAVERGLLSHVGKTPVQTMSARLSAAVSKGNEKGFFVRVRPGVFALSDLGKLEAGKSEPTKPASSAGAVSEPVKAEPKPQTQTPTPTATAAGEGVQLKKKKRRRRKKKTGADGESLRSIPPLPSTAPAATSSSQPASVEKPQPPPAPKPPSTAPESKPRPPQQAPKPLQPAPPTKAPQPAPASRPPQSAPASRPPQPAPSARPPQNERVNFDKKKELTNQIEVFLRSQSRPVPVEAILEHLGQKRDNAVNLVEAILVADGLEREAMGLRPRFVERRNGYTLAEREVSDEILSLERQISDSRARLAKLAERQLLRKLRVVPMKTFVQVMVVYLQRSGFESMVPVERSAKDEFHMSVQDRRHSGLFRTAVVLRRDSADFSLQDRAVIDLRGALHHYDAASGMIVTTGMVSDRAKAEVLVPNLAPVALVDGEALAAEMVRLGIGVRGRAVSLPAFDERFFSQFEAQNRWQ